MPFPNRPSRSVESDRRRMERQRRYPLLTFFDLTLNAVLCSGVFALACALLAVILLPNSLGVLTQIWDVARHIFH